MYDFVWLEQEVELQGNVVLVVVQTLYQDSTNLSSFADSIRSYPPCKNKSLHDDYWVPAIS